MTSPYRWTKPSSGDCPRGLKPASRLRTLEKALLYGIWTGITLILLMPFVVTPQTIFPFIVGKALYSRAIIEVIFGFWALLAFLKPAYRPPRSWVLIGFAIVLGASTLAACSGVSIQRSFWSTYERMQGVVDLAHWFGFAVVLVSVVQTTRNWRVLLNLNLGLSLVMALLAIGQVYYFPEAFFLSWDVPTARVGATLGNPLYLGAYLTVNIIIALGFLAQSFILVTVPSTSPPSRGKRRHQKRRSAQTVKIHSRMLWAQRLFWGSVVLIELWAFSLAGSRGGFIGLITAAGCLGVLGLFLGRTRTVRFASVGLTGLAGLALVLMLAVLSFRPTISMLMAKTELSHPLLRYLTSHGTIQTRFAAWEAGFKGFVAKPLLGWGPENYVVIFGRYVSGVGSRSQIHDNAHSTLVEELSTKGLLGLLSYLSVWGVTFLVVLQASKGLSPKERVLTLFVGATLLGHFVQSQFAIAPSTSFLQYILLLAFVANLERARGGTTPTHGCWARLQQRVSPLLKQLNPTDFLRHNGARTLIAVGVVALVGTGLLTNQAIYSAASIITIRTGTPGQFRRNFQQAITNFKPLANHRRLLFFNETAALWEDLHSRSIIEAERTLALVNTEAGAALESEPENWRIHIALAKLYRTISTSNPEYEDMAKHYLEKSLELAPYRKESLALEAS